MNELRTCLPHTFVEDLVCTKLPFATHMTKVSEVRNPDCLTTFNSNHLTFSPFSKLSLHLCSGTAAQPAAWRGLPLQQSQYSSTDGMFAPGTEDKLLRAESSLAPLGRGHLSSYRGSGWLDLQVPLNPLFKIQLFSLANANIQPSTLST